MTTPTLLPGRQVRGVGAGVVLVCVTLFVAITLGVRLGGGSVPQVRASAAIAYELVLVVAAVFLTISWRLVPAPLVGWFAFVLVATAGSELPFMVVALTDPVYADPSNSEVAEPVIAALGLLAAGLAVRGTGFAGPGPLLLGFLAACGVVLLRANDHLARALPAGWVDGTGWWQKGFLVLCTVVLTRVVLRTPGLPAAVRWPLTPAVLLTGVATVADRARETSSGAPALSASALALLVAATTLTGAVLCLLSALEERSRDAATLAVRAARAEQVARRDADLLDHVRADLRRMTRAVVALDARTGTSAQTPEDRAVAQALGVEIGRLRDQLVAARG